MAKGRFTSVNRKFGHATPKKRFNLLMASKLWRVSDGCRHVGLFMCHRICHNALQI